MITRRTLDGALKWALRDFLLEEWRALEDQVSTAPKIQAIVGPTGIDFRHDGGSLLSLLVVDEVLGSTRSSRKCVCQDIER